MGNRIDERREKMKTIRVGVIGAGNMGTRYAQKLADGKIDGAVLSAIYVRSEKSVHRVKEVVKSDAHYFTDLDSFFKEANVDAVIIATPHYSHPDIAIWAFEKGLHVLIDKPAGVFAKNVLKMNEIAKNSGNVFGIIYNQRANPLYQKLRELISSGALGEIKRTNWIITNWYRSQSYYDLVEWRGTWANDGGGVLLNQSPHQLDLWQWTTGLMPKRVYGFCGFGRYHDIEVEDDVTAYVEYENGATGTFITSTGEAPGTNRFEVVGDRGKMVVENGELIFHRLKKSERQFNKTYTGGMGSPKTEEINISIEGEDTGHTGIMQNFVDAILHGTALLAPGEEGIKGLEISNAIYLSAWLKEPVHLPVDPDLYYAKLQEQIQRHQD